MSKGYVAGAFCLGAILGAILVIMGAPFLNRSRDLFEAGFEAPCADTNATLPPSAVEANATLPPPTPPPSALPPTSTAGVRSIFDELQDYPVFRKTSFELSENLLRQSRPNVGNTQRLHTFLRKLSSGVCTRIAFIGGSVTAGHNGGGPTHSYPKKFIDWLNFRYPCNQNGQNGTGHMRLDFAMGGLDTSLFLPYYDTGFGAMPHVDMVMIEFNVNDQFISDKGDWYIDKVNRLYMQPEAAQFFLEILIRKLLRLRKPDPVAVVYFSADFKGRPWSFPPYTDPNQTKKKLFLGTMEPVTYYLTNFYGIPLFSVVNYLLPTASRRGRDMMFDRTDNQYSISAWHADACCHPLKEGHTVLAVTLAYNIVKEMNYMLAHTEESEADVDYSQQDPPIMRQALKLSPEEVLEYVVKASPFLLDLTKPTVSVELTGSIVATNWRHYADNKEHDKFGMITDTVNAHISFRLTGGPKGDVEVTSIKSYENFGNVLLWVDDTPGFTGDCTYDASAKATRPQIKSRWTIKASVADRDVFNLFSENQTKFVHFCMLPKDEGIPKEEMNKFKIMYLRML